MIKDQPEDILSFSNFVKDMGFLGQINRLINHDPSTAKRLRFKNYLITKQGECFMICSEELFKYQVLSNHYTKGCIMIHKDHVAYTITIKSFK